MSEMNTVKSINITASTSYDGKQVPVKVNSQTPLKLESDDYEVFLIVHIKDYLNEHTDEKGDVDSFDYFSSELHNKDSFSIQFVVVFKKDVRGDKLQFGNDWDSPIRDILPWGFSAAFATFKYTIDPGVDGDPYADKPWIYGAALSSINYIQKLDPEANPGNILGLIEEIDPKSRQRKYLDKEELKKFTFKEGERYMFDFSNPYLDLSSSPKLKLPGFTFDVGKYAGMTKLRYVLKDGENLVFSITFNAEK